MGSSLQRDGVLRQDSDVPIHRAIDLHASAWQPVLCMEAQGPRRRRRSPCLCHLSEVVGGTPLDLGIGQLWGHRPVQDPERVLAYRTTIRRSAGTGTGRRVSGEKETSERTHSRTTMVTMPVAASCATVLLSSIAAPTLAFAPRSSPLVVGDSLASSPLFLSSSAKSAAATQPTEISGAPSDEARNVDPRDALSKSTVYRLDGTAVPTSTLLRDDGGIDLRDELLANDVDLTLISIGKPEIGLELMEHLGIDGGAEWIYADPENDAYDRLRLNRGWDTMIRPATAFRFKDRIFGDGAPLDSLFDVLGKWKDGKVQANPHPNVLCEPDRDIIAVYIPPKLDQSTNHGGTFMFDGDQTVYAYYDESPGTHADPFGVVEKAIEVARRKSE
ncbi:hypothetical protein THAOC_16447 [Thalassiosira oceanica]|uniref:Uncharacterized protein n=1 Tax=Thalassiosira oceanica TaxID=159749 RepID=K0S9T1_THAOC|nr:hypothetical protein THAOC_16447 [Thalassiosira oceanica]|eukprot:EJK62923.1 hypothetical protein THAOC_16447 [Thalassiosira oceanica]